MALCVVEHACECLKTGKTIEFLEEAGSTSNRFLAEKNVESKPFFSTLSFSSFKMYMLDKLLREAVSLTAQ